MNAARLEQRSSEARAALEGLYAALRARGMCAPARPEGQLIRPLLSLAGAEALGLQRDARFWAAAAAVQLAHEASLVHDDIIDEATTRRSRATAAAARGVAAALVEGDHLLTTSYRLAAAAESSAFCVAFAHAVERTVAGEKLQGRATGMRLDEPAYRRIIAGKSGELLGCALAAGAYVSAHPSAGSLYVLGRCVGELYQMLDDLLDYCPDVDTGKPALTDYRQRRWTWPLLELGTEEFDDDAATVAASFAYPDAAGTSPLRRCLARFEDEADGARAAIAVHMPTDEVVSALVEQWRQRARAAAERVEAAAQRRRARDELAALVPDSARLSAFFETNSRTFSFAARAFPPGFRERVTRVYAFCRITDDIADAPRAAEGLATRLERLEQWRMLAHNAYCGDDTGIDLLNRVMTDARAADVPFQLVDELIEGMRMDLRGVRYATFDELSVYTYRVAGVVGQWLTRLCGVHDEGILERAADLGHALQLTNIIRDVGEDLRVGRVYIPHELLQTAGLDDDALRVLAAAGRPMPGAYREMIEQLIDRADEHYARALDATPALPAYFRYAVRIAAHVYRGIHDEVRRNGYDNLTRRAHTSAATRLRLAARALGRGDPRARDGLPAVLHTTARRARTATFIVLLSAGAGAATGAAAQSYDPTSHVLQTRERLVALPQDTTARLNLVRALFFVAVDREDAIAQGYAAIADIRDGFPGLAERRRPLLDAYEGAFNALDARHGFWPHARLRAVRRGLQRLDAAVSAAPNDLEVRYLRMINGFYLPSLFGRGAEVREDLAVLSRELATATADYPPMLYDVMAKFVLEHGSPAPQHAALLRASLQRQASPP